MYDINIDNILKEKNIYRIIIYTGIIFFMLSTIMVINNLKILRKTDISIMSEKVDNYCSENSQGEYLCKHKYTYYANGTRYVCDTGILSGTEETKNKRVYFSSDNPNICFVKQERQTILIVIFYLFAVIEIPFGTNRIIIINKKINKLKVLREKGTLIKNLKYKKKKTYIEINDKKIFRPIVEYEVNDKKIKLIGERLFENNDSKVIDLLIDLNDINNYYIDFNIKKNENI